MKTAVQTFLGDCLEVMNGIPDKSVDMVLCDLPYGTTRNAWDEIIPMANLWDAYHRIVRGGGVIALFSQAPFSYIVGGSNLSEFRYEWIWRKSTITGQLNANRAPLKCHENIQIFCDKGPAYNPQVSYTAPKRVVDCPSNSTNYGSCGKRKGSRRVNFTYPWDVLEFEVNHDEKIHPTQKPVGLCEYLIRTYTDEGMTVLDNCMGSGTTGVAAVQTGRSFIGIEKDPTYYSKAVERINKAEYNARTKTTLEAFA